LRAIVIDANQTARLRPLVIGRDYGTSLEVLGDSTLKTGSFSTLQIHWKKANQCT
jgi:hypothetical protein